MSSSVTPLDQWRSRLSTFELFKAREVRLICFWASLPNMSSARWERLEDLRATVREREITSDPLWAPLLWGDKYAFLVGVRKLWGIKVTDPKKPAKSTHKKEITKFEEGEL